MGKVVLFNTSFFEISETFIHQQASFLQNDFEITLLCKRTNNLDKFPLDKMKTVEVYSENSIVWKIWYRLKRLAGLKTFLPYRERQKIKRYLQAESVELVHAHFGYNAVGILPVVRELGIPLIVTFHGYDASKMIVHQKKYRKALGELLKYSAKILLVSDHMRETLEIPDKYNEKVLILPCSVDVNVFVPTARKAVSDVITILHAGRMVGKKGVPDLVRVFYELQKEGHKVELHLLGGGEELELVNRLITEFGLEGKVFLYGVQPQIKVKELMALADIFVLNSRIAENGDMEGLPVTLLEAMSMGKAIVTTRHAGIPYAIRNNENGLLVEERNNEQLLAAIKELVQDAPLRIRLGIEARKSAEKKFSLEILGKQLIYIYRNSLRPSYKGV